jgi:hypothetical protein
VVARALRDMRRAPGAGELLRRLLG